MEGNMSERNDRVDDQLRQRAAGDPNQEKPRDAKQQPGQHGPRKSPHYEQSDLPEAAKDLSRPQHDLTEDESEEKTP